MEQPTELYRYEIIKRSGLSDQRFLPSLIDVDLKLYVFKIVKYTPQGYWINIYDYKQKWIGSNTKRKYAYPTKKEAIESCFYRTKKRLDILNAQLAFVKVGIQMVEKEMEFITKKNHK